MGHRREQRQVLESQNTGDSAEEKSDRREWGRGLKNKHDTLTCVLFQIVTEGHVMFLFELSLELGGAMLTAAGQPYYQGRTERERETTNQSLLHRVFLFIVTWSLFCVTCFSFIIRTFLSMTIALHFHSPWVFNFGNVFCPTSRMAQTG